jgi:hypothetical protein
MIVSDDTTIWSVTYDRHYDDRNSFTIQDTGYVLQQIPKVLLTQKPSELEKQNKRRFVILSESFKCD